MCFESVELVVCCAVCLRALGSGFGLPQRRRRCYIVASLHGDPRDVLLSQNGRCSGQCANGPRHCNTPLIHKVFFTSFTLVIVSPPITATVR